MIFRRRVAGRERAALTHCLRAVVTPGYRSAPRWQEEPRGARRGDRESCARERTRAHGGTVVPVAEPTAFSPGAPRLFSRLGFLKQRCRPLREDATFAPRPTSVSLGRSNDEPKPTKAT